MKRMFSAIKRELWGCPVERAYHQAAKAAQRAAVLKGERMFHVQMMEFHGAQLKTIDPNTHWWEWARTKEAIKRCNEDYAFIDNKSKEATANQIARQVQYEKLRAENQ